MAPYRLAHEIGLDWDTLPEIQVMGIEGSGVKGRVGSLPIRFKNLQLTVRCVFVKTPKSLFLLGRADFLDRFVMTIDHHEQKIILTEIL